jgi:hypothetical protein
MPLLVLEERIQLWRKAMIYNETNPSRLHTTNYLQIVTGTIDTLGKTMHPASFHTGIQALACLSSWFNNVLLHVLAVLHMSKITAISATQKQPLGGSSIVYTGIAEGA